MTNSTTYLSLTKQKEMTDEEPSPELDIKKGESKGYMES